MRPLNISKAIIGVVYFINICCFAANTGPKPLVLNLALVDPGSSITISGNRKFDYIVIENVINGYAYSVEIRNEAQLLPPLESAAAISKAFGRLSPECEELKAALTKVEGFQEDIYNTSRLEKDLGDFSYTLDILINAQKCNNSQVKESASFWLRSTKKVLDERVDVESGKVVTIIIKRGDMEWKFIFQGDTPGKWVTTYGFGFTTNALRGNSYYTKQLEDSSVFEILKSRGPKAFDLNYVPAVFFTFFPSKRKSKCWNHSLTGGLGFDLQAPVLYFGYNGLYWHNIGFSAGLAFQQQNVLKDQFEVNDKVSMFMDTGQLHDKVYRPNLFISLHFRLDKNPFDKE